jgi:hypothetical protein
LEFALKLAFFSPRVPAYNTETRISTVLEGQGGGLIYGMFMKSDLACINHIPIPLFIYR